MRLQDDLDDRSEEDEEDDDDFDDDDNEDEDDPGDDVDDDEETETWQVDAHSGQPAARYSCLLFASKSTTFALTSVLVHA